MEKETTLPDIFDSVEQAVIMLKLDGRHKWEVWDGELTYPFKYKQICTGCNGGGCSECGYHGNSISYVPCPAFMPDGSIVKIKPTTP